MIIRLILLLVVGVLFSTVDGFGDVITKDGIKIQVFRRGEKNQFQREN